MLIVALISFTVLQPPAQPSAPAGSAPGLRGAPADPGRAPPAAAPASQAGAPTPTLDRLEPASRRAVEQHARNFVVTRDGTWWDRQLWLERQELRERLKRSASLPPKPTDHQRALGASKDAPSDPYNPADGIEWKEWQIKTGEMKRAYMYGDDHTNPPLWRTVGGRAAVTGREIIAACNAHREKMGMFESEADRRKLGDVAPPLRETVTPEELALAVREGKAELSEFRWVKRVISKAEPERRNREHQVVSRARPEVAEYSWVREAVAVRWKKGA